MTRSILLLNSLLTLITVGAAARSQEVDYTSYQPTQKPYTYTAPDYSKYTNTGVYGVSGLATESTTLTRTNAAINKTANVQTYSNREVSNDFDNIMPWAGMHEIQDTRGNTYIRIPAHWEYKTADALAVSMEDHSNQANWIYCQQFDIGKYKATGAKYDMRSQLKGTYYDNSSINDHRLTSAYMTSMLNDDYLYSHMDIRSLSIIQTLFLVEFATKDSQSIMHDLVYTNQAQADAGTAQVLEKANITNGYNDQVNAYSTAFYYRGIQNLWNCGAVLVDGLYIANDIVYVCDDPNDYADTTKYRALGIAPTYGSYVTNFKFETGSEYINLPSADNTGSTSTYFCDQFKTLSTSDSQYYIAFGVGSSCTTQSPGGLFAVSNYHLYNKSAQGTGSRLIRYAKDIEWSDEDE